MNRKSSKLAVVALAAAFLASTAARAQVPSASLPPFQPKTYSASFTGLAIPLSAAMDAVCLVGSAKLVKILRISVSGTDATAQTATVSLVKRTAANSGGTSTNATNGQADSIDAAPTAVLTGYTAAPTPGAGVAIRSVSLGLNAANAAPPQQLVWDFNPQLLQKPLILRGTSQQACVNLPNALTSAGASLNVDVTWTEQ